MAHALLIDPDQPTCRWLKGVLEREQFSVAIAHSAEQARQSSATQTPQIIILELGLPDLDGIELIRQLKQHNGTRNASIIVLTNRVEIQDIQASLDAGASEYLAKRPGVDADLVTKIRALSARPVPAPAPKISYDSPATSASTSTPVSAPTGISGGRGKIFAFCSAKGGTGVTTACINTAYALTRIENRARVLVADMVFPLGTLGAFLDYESGQTAARLTKTAPEKMDANFIKGFISPDPDHALYILLGANDVKEATMLDPTRVAPLFETLRGMYDYVCVDFGRGLSRISLPVIERADAVVLVLTADQSMVKMTKIVLEHFQSLGIESKRIVTLNNRMGPRMWMEKEDIEDKLGLAIGGTIPHEPENFVAAANIGIPFTEKFPERPPTAAFIAFAKMLMQRSYRA